jgi:hypothetical protein
MGWLFDTQHFVTRDHCGAWQQWLIVVAQSANFLIFLAYASIPLSLTILLVSLYRDPDLKDAVFGHHPCILAMFVAFIFSCGLTHLMDVLVFDWPAYRFFVFLDVVTALASVPTAFLLPGVIRKTLHGVKKRQ